jgi:DNA polymerase-3 subunit epsilon
MIALFFDTETTGIPSEEFRPRLVQIAGILYDLDTGRVLAEINFIASQYPGNTIPAEVVAIHGIDDNMAAIYGFDPKLIDLVFSEMINKADLLVAHNLEFDLKILKLNMPLSFSDNLGLKNGFCTMIENVDIVKKPKKPGSNNYDKPEKKYAYPSLADTYRHYFKADIFGAHDAMVDVRACQQIYLEMTAVDPWQNNDNQNT